MGRVVQAVLVFLNDPTPSHSQRAGTRSELVAHRRLSDPATG
jgi:hypothetical protein